MDCLSDYIGVRGGCGTTVPPSSLYVNDLPGISFRQISSLADTQQQTFTGVWQDIQTRAQLRLSDDVRTEFGRKYKINRVLDSVKIPRDRVELFEFGTIPPPDPADGIPYQWVGMTIDMDYGVNQNEEYINSPLMNLYVQEIYIFADYNSYGGEVIDVAIFDMLTYEQLFFTQFTVPFINYWSKIDVNDTFLNDVSNKSRKIGIFYRPQITNTTITPNLLDLSGIRNEGCDCKTYVRGCVFKGFETPTNTFIEGNDSFGIAPIFGIQCDYANVICTNKDLFSRAYLYALGYETMLEQAYSDRLNEYSLVRRAQALENMERFMLEYSAALKNVVSGIDLGCDCCIDCGGTSKPYITEQTP